MVKLALNLTGVDEASEPDKDIHPYESIVNAQSTPRSMFHVTKIRFMASQVWAFADVKVVPNSNPVDMYHVKGCTREDLLVVCTL